MHGAQDTVTGGFVGAHLGATDVTGKPSRPSALLQTQRAQHAARPGAGFVEFVPRLGVGGHAGAVAEAQLGTLDPTPRAPPGRKDYPRVRTAAGRMGHSGVSAEN